MARHRTRNFRPNPDYYEPTETAAEQAGVSMNILLQAMLREFLTDPSGRLAALQPHLAAVSAETPPRGRPPTRDGGGHPAGRPAGARPVDAGDARPPG